MARSEISVRPATKEDLEAILFIYNDAIVNTTAVYDYEPHTIAMRQKWFEEKKKSNLPVFVAEFNSEVVGFASYGPFRPWAAYKFTVEHSVYVHPAHRRKGIAKYLLKQIVETCRERSVHTIIAGIDASNEISIKLHKKSGFLECGSFKEVGYKFGKWLDLKFMQLVLPPPEQL